MSSRVEIYIKLPGLGNEIAANVSQALAARVTRLARQKVRVSTEATVPGGPHGVLRNSIRNIGLSRTHFVVISDLPYSAAQEWGLAKYGKKEYGFTPYMEPSAREVMQPQIYKSIVKDAELGAIEKQRRRS